MKLQNLTPYISAPATALMVLAVMLVAVTIVQAMVVAAIPDANPNYIHGRQPGVAPDRSTRTSVLNVITAVSPPVYSPAWRWRFRDVWYQRDSQPAALVAVSGLLREIRPSHVSNIFVVVAMLALAIWHAWPRRTSWLALALWMMLIAAFSVAGFLTYLSLNHTATIRCGACGRKRGLQKPSCAFCNAPLPAPRRKETDLVDHPNLA